MHDLLGRTPLEHVPELLATGRHGERAYDVFELVEGGTLADLARRWPGAGLSTASSTRSPRR